MSRARRWLYCHYGGSGNEVADTWRETTHNTMSVLTDIMKQHFRARQVNRNGAGDPPARASATQEDSNFALDGCGPISTVSVGNGSGNPFAPMEIPDNVRVLGIGGRSGAYLDRIRCAHGDRVVGNECREYRQKAAGDPHKVTGRNQV